MVATDSLVRWRCNPERKYMARGTYPVARKDALDSTINLTPYLHPKNDFVTPVPRLPRATAHSEVLQLMQHITDFESIWTPQAYARFVKVSDAIREDIKFADVSPASHRLRSPQGSAMVEPRLSIRDMRPPARRVIERGLLFSIDDEGRASLMDMTERAKDEDWGFDVRALRREAIKLKWPYRELIAMLEFGASDYSPSTTPFSSLSAHCVETMKLFDDLVALFNKELKDGWFTKALRFPPYVPFYAPPAKLVDKDDGTKSRLVMNASYPYANVRDGAFRAGTEKVWPVVTNSYTQIPPYLDVEWPSVESMAELFSILYSAAQCAGLTIELRKWDIKKYFRQIALMPAERHKAIALVRDGFHADRRLQMGRTIAAHVGMRITKLLCDIIERRAVKDDWVGFNRADASMSSSSLAALRAWTNERRQFYSRHPRQARLVLATPFQDDIMVSTVGAHAALKATEGIEQIMQEFGIPLSEKPHCNIPFAQSSTALGAKFDAMVYPPVFQAADDKLERFAKLIDELRLKQGGWYRYAQCRKWPAIWNTWAGSLATVCSAHRRHILPRRWQRVVRCVCVRLHGAKSCRCASFFATFFEVRGVRGWRILSTFILGLTDSPPMPAPSKNAPGGWGVCVFGVCAHGKWEPRVEQAFRQKIISVSPAELILVAAAVIVGRKLERIQHIARVIWRTDNGSAWCVHNARRDTYRAMLVCELLRALKQPTTSMSSRNFFLGNGT